MFQVNHICCLCCLLKPLPLLKFPSFCGSFWSISSFVCWKCDPVYEATSLAFDRKDKFPVPGKGKGSKQASEVKRAANFILIREISRHLIVMKIASSKSFVDCTICNNLEQHLVCVSNYELRSPNSLFIQKLCLGSISPSPMEDNDRINNKI